eukprot:scaffold1789_cov46-Phaeocystis_antarctica.AAC.2
MPRTEREWRSIFSRSRAAASSPDLAYSSSTRLLLIFAQSSHLVRRHRNDGLVVGPIDAKVLLQAAGLDPRLVPLLRDCSLLLVVGSKLRGGDAEHWSTVSRSVVRRGGHKTVRWANERLERRENDDGGHGARALATRPLLRPFTRKRSLKL